MAREYFPGVGEAVAARTITRGSEKWGDVAKRVAWGNNSLAPSADLGPLEAAIADGRILMSGRHLQHGDGGQASRNIEVFTNCSTASQRALVFYLLLNGSGVGTSYDDDMCIVDWSKMPTVVPVLSRDHADYTGEFMVPDDEGLLTFVVPDSREGWAEAVQFIEDLTFEGTHADETVVIDFSNVRPMGSPIGGMQERPSSGPVPLMQAMVRMNGVSGPLWRQAMEIDHLLAEIVLVGGARRSARIAVKWWQDDDIIDFINVKQQGGLWSANNSIGVDAGFWRSVAYARKHGITNPAWVVFEAATRAQYLHGTGEPAFLNMDMLQEGETTASATDDLHLAGPFNMSAVAIDHRRALMAACALKKYQVIVNPCGEIRLCLNGGYCVIADVAIAHCYTQDQFNEAVRLSARALVRTNTMEALFQGEVDRTNRIGVALTGIHEYAWQRFGLTFKDLVARGETTIVDANGQLLTVPADRALPFWHSLYEAALEVDLCLADYCDELGVVLPLTSRTIKPSGSVSKLFALTEGAHLAAMREYLRWVQFRNDSPLIAEYEAAGYPIRRDLRTYKNVTIVGFPTRLPIVEMMGDQLVTAADATFEEQIRWIRLLETYWLLREGGNQISYTLKYRPSDITLDEYQELVATQVPTVRAVSIMPQIDSTAYEYQPEEPISAATYDAMMAKITRIAEDVGREHVDCASGVCPVDFRTAA